MNTARDIISYAEQHDIHISTNEGQLILNAPKEALTDDFLESAKQYKSALIKELSDGRWNPELVIEDYVWCLDCQHFNGVNCNHTDNPFHTVTKCPQAPRKCQWYEENVYR